MPVANVKPVVLVSKLDGTVLQEFGSCTECDRYIGAPAGSTSMAVRKNTLTYRSYFPRRPDEYRGYECFEDRYNSPIAVFNGESKVCTWYPTIATAAWELGFDPSTIACTIKYKDGRLGEYLIGKLRDTRHWPELVHELCDEWKFEVSCEC